MGTWPSALLSRVAVIVVLGVLTTATLTWAAEKQLTAPKPVKVTAAAVQTAVIVVPDVHGQAYVFAKGILEDNGFAWRVGTGAAGYAANTVVAQSPAAGTRVVDTGAPLVTLTLKRNTHYAEKGTPDNASPFPATEVRLPVAATPAPAVTPKPAATPAPAATPKPATTPAATTKPAATPKPHRRTPDFVVPGAPKEPLKEMPLPDRARLLGVWLSTHKAKTQTNVRHWLYQNAWVVTGARFGWWHGAEALKILIQVDREAQSAWGIGGRSESLASAALAEVRARAK
jgi:PASTA domain